jgi:spore coat protein A
MITRRQLLKGGTAGALGLIIPSAAFPAAPMAAASKPATVPLFTVRLPVPAKATPVSVNTFHVTQRQTRQRLHPMLGRTTVWGYDDGATGPTYPGPTIEVQKGTPVTVSWTNQLPTTHLLPVDTSLTGGDASVRTLTHMHGNLVSGASDGNPYATPAPEHVLGETQTAFYPNEQPPTTLWYHDHAHGLTRLNVYAGLAGYYLIRDAHDTGAEPNPIGIPGGQYEIPIVIQDRSFDENGQLLYLPPFGFGDTAVVNGVAFPFLNVEPRKYRFRFLNGANHRFFHLELADGPPFHQIGAEGGMFDAPVVRERLLMGSADRADVIVDFAGFEGKQLVLRNVDLPASVVSAPAVNLPEIMLFRVLGAGTTVNSPGPATIPTSLPGSLPNFGPPQRERYITLEFAAGRFLIDGLRFHDPVTIQVPEGDVEDWLLINLTGATHPIHVHLVQFQIVSRRPFDVTAYRAALTAARANNEPAPDPAPYYTGGPLPLQTNDIGFKDNAFANPREVTRIRARYELPQDVTGTQKYVLHCHLLEHEDDDMMRPFEVVM